jgi:hypothetical protein
MVIAVSMLSGVACNGVSWPSERIVRSLRVLGVQAEPASVTPGQSSQLSMLCADGIGGPNTDTQCDVEVAWFGACNNPLNNDPLKCLHNYADWVQYFASPLADTPSVPAIGQFKIAPQFEYQAPENVLVSEVNVGGESIHYGTSYVFFAACAGTLYPASGLADQLPVQCRDRNSGALLDQRRFVVGVTTIYAYDKIVNHNPQLTRPLWDYVPIPDQTCSTDGDCGTGYACAGDAHCAPIVRPCRTDVPGSCNNHYLGMLVPPLSFVVTGLDGTPILRPMKSLWIDCYANAGALPDDARQGLEPPNVGTGAAGCAAWQAPTQATEQARLWMVLRDDRGGIAWHEQRIFVR